MGLDTWDYMFLILIYLYAFLFILIGLPPFLWVLIGFWPNIILRGVVHIFHNKKKEKLMRLRNKIRNLAEKIRNPLRIGEEE